MIKRILGLAILALSCIAPKLHAQSCVTQSQVTLTGNLRSGNGLPSKNYTLSFRPSQQGYIAGCGVNIPTTFACATSTDGSVVGLPNPLTTTSNTTAGTGSLTPGIYYSVYAWYDAAGHLTLVSPESRVQLSSSGSVVINPPASGTPSGALGMQVYLSTSPGAETLQGFTTGGSYVQSTALINGASPQTSNNTLCTPTANDSMWPVGTGYVVSLTDSNGNSVPSYPMQWQLNGPGTTINLSNGLPYYHGVVQYPIPLLVQPQNHGQQSIGGNLNFGGYQANGLGAVGIGTNTPAFALDVRGLINTNVGYLFNSGAGTAGQCLVSNGTAFVPGTCAIPGGQPYYYFDQNNSSPPLPQRAVNDFIAPLTVGDDPTNNRTQIGLLSSGVTPGSYTGANITVDTYGRVTAAASGSAPQYTLQTLHITANGCTTSGAETYCSLSPASWPTPFPGVNYNTTCTYSGVPTGSGGHPGLYGPYVVAQANGTITVTIQAGSGSAGGNISNPLITCLGFYPN